MVGASLPGFPSGPFTKTGKSVLVLPGPWHYAMRGLGVYYKADPSALESVVPKPLKVGSGVYCPHVWVDKDLSLLRGYWQAGPRSSQA